jgi:beta-N-acetylhexosaminidase
VNAERLAASVLLVGFDGTDASDPAPEAVAALGVGGFVLFGRNVESPEQVHRLLAGLRERSGGRPILLCVDQEGGRVARLRAPLTVWPPFERLGRLDDAEAAEALGRAMAKELRAVGFNCNFAPCVDVNSNPDNPVIGDRALAAVPGPVQRLGPAFARGMQSEGMLASAKHFPGHGDVDVDSHLDLPRCDLTLDELEAVHLAPFAAVIAAGVGSIMSAHVVYPAVDPDHPATLSARWIQGVLRDRLGHSGVVFTDDLEMGAIVEHHGIGAAAVAAVGAGVDGVLICRRLDRVREAVTALAAAIESDPEFAERCREARGRLEAAARRFPPRPLPLSELAGAFRPPEHLELAARLAAASPSPLQSDPTAILHPEGIA